MTVRHLLILLLVLVFLADNSLIAPGEASTNTSPYTQTSARKAKEAKKLFNQKCAKCHGSDGAGQTVFGQIVSATDLTDPVWQDKVDDRQILNSITHGRGQMPSFGKKLSKEQITSLSDYVRAFRK